MGERGQQRERVDHLEERRVVPGPRYVVVETKCCDRVDSGEQAGEIRYGPRAIWRYIRRDEAGERDRQELAGALLRLYAHLIPPAGRTDPLNSRLGHCVVVDAQLVGGVYEGRAEAFWEEMSEPLMRGGDIVRLQATDGNACCRGKTNEPQKGRNPLRGRVFQREFVEDR